MGSRRKGGQRESGSAPGAAAATERSPRNGAGASVHGHKRPVLRFVLTFIALMAGFYLVTWMAWYQDRFFPWYLDLNADASAMVLRVFGEAAESPGREVRSDARAVSLSIEAGCDAIEPAAMFAAAVMAFPAAISLRIIGVFIGVPLLLLTNLARIVSLYYIRIFAPNWFETAHVDIWQPLFILLALAGWIVWVVWAMRRMAGSSSS